MEKAHTPSLARTIRVPSQRSIRIIPRRTLPRNWAFMDDESPGPRLIFLDPRQSDPELLNSAIYEFTHVILPDLDEAAVIRLADAASQYLLSTGWHRYPDCPD